MRICRLIYRLKFFQKLRLQKSKFRSIYYKRQKGQNNFLLLSKETNGRKMQEEHQTYQKGQLSGQLSFVWQSLHKTFNFSQEEMVKMNNLLSNEMVDFGLGSMYGAFIGDALGSYCEFKPEPFQQNDPQLEEVMQMPGKGTFNTKPGQFTDDSEMASHMLEALSSYDPNFPLEDQKTSILIKIAHQYVDWYNTEPYDIGITTRNALLIVRNDLKHINQEKDSKETVEKKLNDIFEKIRTRNLQSCSNGSLMRITPMAFFISLLLEKQRHKNPQAECRDFKDFIRSEINMTHGNEEVFESSYAWVELLVEIIHRKQSKGSLKVIYNDFVQKYKENKFIGEWVRQTLDDEEMIATVHEGWVKIGFTYGIRALKALSEIEDERFSEQNYISIIRRVISKAGDTDTNAAIVGGLIGAVVGFKGLPRKYLFKQFNLELNEKDAQCQHRGSFYEPKRQFVKAMKLIKKFKN